MTSRSISSYNLVDDLKCNLLFRNTDIFEFELKNKIGPFKRDVKTGVVEVGRVVFVLTIGSIAYGLHFSFNIII